MTTTPINDSADQLLTVDKVAALLGMSGAWVRQHASHGAVHTPRPSIPSLKLGKSVRFRRRAVLDFIASLEKVA
jgi:predicted DNA-binding transcriptional regulator AlpA